MLMMMKNGDYDNNDIKFRSISTVSTVRVVLVGREGEFLCHWFDPNTTAQLFLSPHATTKLFPYHWFHLQIPPCTQLIFDDDCDCLIIMNIFIHNLHS